MNIKFKQTVFFIFCIIALAGCDKNEIKPLQEPVNSVARITVINAVPGSPGLDAFYGDLKLNGNAIIALTRFPNAEYSVIPPATYTIKTVVSRPTVIPAIAPLIPFGVTVTTTTTALEADKYYSLYIVGAPVVSNITSFLVEDKIPIPVSDKAHVRFINAMPDGNNMALLSGVIPTGSVNPTTSTPIFTNLARNTARDFIAIDAINVGSPYQFQLRDNVTGTLIGTPVNLNVVTGRVYTFFARGFNTTFTVPGFTPVRTVAAILPTTASLSLMTNR